MKKSYLRRYAAFSALSAFGHLLLVGLGALGISLVFRLPSVHLMGLGILILVQMLLGLSVYFFFEGVRYKIARAPAPLNTSWQNSVGSLLGFLGGVWYYGGILFGITGFFFSLDDLSACLALEISFGAMTGGYGLGSLGDLLKAFSSPENDPNYDTYDHIR